MPKTLGQHLWDLIGAPLRMTVLPDDLAPRLGWTSKEEERLAAVRPYLRGYLLDVGAGPNRLVRDYGHGIGVDVWDWGGGVMVVEDTAELPFAPETFDTVTFVACLNHIPNRGAVIAEAVRVLKPGGRVLATMIPRWVGEISHRLSWYGEEKHRDVAEGEVFGMSPAWVIELCANAGLELVMHRRFYYRLNHLFMFRKPDSSQES